LVVPLATKEDCPVVALRGHGDEPRHQTSRGILNSL